MRSFLGEFMVGRWIAGVVAVGALGGCGGDSFTSTPGAGAAGGTAGGAGGGAGAGGSGLTGGDGGAGATAGAGGAGAIGGSGGVGATGGGGGVGAMGGTGGAAGSCGAQMKSCAEQCVPVDSPAFGCAAASCDACPVPEGGSALCKDGRCAALCGNGLVACEGSCVDLSQDDLHCGACGHACLGSTCAAGLCVPTPLATSTGSGAIVVDADNVYWATNTSAATVQRVPKDGGPIVTLATGQAFPFDLTADASRIYWSNQTAVMAVVKSGAAAPIELAINQSEVMGVAVSDSHVYWADRGAQTVRYVSTAGGPAQTLATAQADVADLAFAQGYVFWSLYRTGGSIVRGKLTGNVTPLVSGADKAWTIATDDTAVYYALDAGEVWRVGHDGSKNQRLASGLAEPYDIVVDGTHAYVGLVDGVVRVDKLTPGNAERLVTSTSKVVDIAVGDRFVYWVDGVGVYKVAK